MLSHEVGSLLKRLRKQKGITQLELAHSCGVDPATISKIENGKSSPNRETVLALFQKLGFDTNGTINFFFTEEEAEFENAKNKMNRLMYLNDIPELNAMIEYFEQNEKLMSDRLVKQYIIHMRAMSLIKEVENESLEKFDKATLSSEEMEKARKETPLSQDTKNKQDNIDELLYESIKITIPSFNLEELDEYYLSVVELRIVNMLAVQYHRRNEHDRAIELYIAISKGLEREIDPNQRGGRYPTIVSSLAKILIEKSRFKEAIEYCDLGIKTSIETTRLHLVPTLLYHKADALYQSGNAEEAQEQIRRAYWMAKAVEVPNVVSASVAFCDARDDISL